MCTYLIIDTDFAFKNLSLALRLVLMSPGLLVLRCRQVVAAKTHTPTLTPLHTHVNTHMSSAFYLPQLRQPKHTHKQTHVIARTRAHVQ